ncbi:formin-J [Agrilus planipennis]|uniref:Formin-J n=1 Tax=Agrilus planipennis TaxID=224129 RepID=A0A1W4XHH1_AGRPL|nr:formin-J [Agrilus planipennis]
MDSRLGLDFIVENPEYIGKLAAALDSGNVTVKKQVIELLSALCVHNQEGHARALDTLDYCRKSKGERYRFSFIVKELDRTTAVDYQTALVAFINCLIISTPRVVDRTRLRNEFIGCHLLPVLGHLRKCAEAEPELAVQLDVFDEQRESDDANLQGPHGVDLSSPLDVFYAILKQVADTPQEIPFLSILQHLLRIDPKEAISDIVWDTAERLVHRATLLENREDASRLLRAPSIAAKLFCPCQHRSEGNQSRRQSLNTMPLSPPPGPHPPPNLTPSQPPPPPPPPNIPPPPSAPPPAPMPPPPMQKINTSAASKANENEKIVEKLPQQETPQPKIKMKTINWNKIPSHKVVGKQNIWTQLAYNHQHSPLHDMDWSEMEGLFCQPGPPSSANSSPKLGNRDGSSDTLERRMRKDNSEITLLDGKRSLNVNIFLKQFRSSNEDIVQLIKNGEHDDIGAEKLKGLLKILPEVDELDMLKSFTGDYNKLGNAEKFLMQLTSLSNYKLRIESMLLKEEFASNMNYLEPSIRSMKAAAEDLMTNKPLQEVLYMILVAGNFLNSGGYAGDAAGVKLSSLQKITDIRANKPNMNLIHFVAMQAEKRNKNLLSFTDNIGILEEAAKNTVEQLHNEINALDIRIKKITKQIETPTTEPEIQLQMIEFLEMAEREVANLQRNMCNLENVRQKLADFFCEDVNSFKLEECFRIFHNFYTKFKQAVFENARRKAQEEQANARRRQREELIANKRRQMGNLVGTPDSEGTFDTQIYDPRSGFAIRKGWRVPSNSNLASEDELSIAGSPLVTRRRLGSFSGQNNGDSTPSATGKDEKSPDITPNGSLRRRRSRVLSEEDEGNLMEFLRSSGQDNNRERKSWGSLDRSWARRARGSGPRKRPNLLGADFSNERERPSSPSPLAETKPVLPSTEEGTKPKEWRQKIESWLQANENDNEEARKQNRRITNRRSLEMDSESERSSNLETLPEGKQVYTGGQSIYRRVYPDWTPSSTFEKTDVVGAIETVEDAQPTMKDKSAWRKSNLNVANSMEPTKEDRHRIVVPRISQSEPDPNTEEDSRKSLISSLGVRPASDKLTLYIRKPSDPAVMPEPNTNLNNIPHAISNSQQSLESQSTNKVDIDQDNIETPPMTRKIFTPTPVDKREPQAQSPCRRFLVRSSKESLGSPEEPENNTSLGDGQFDRFSATRRTRRYKRNPENNEAASPELMAETEILKTNAMQAETSTLLIEPELDRESRLKAWQDRLKTQSENQSETKHASNKRNRNQTLINEKDVLLALKSKGSDENVKESDKNRSFKLKSDALSSSKIDIPIRKCKEHDHDEGFEESQSLMSESPSQGASSGGGNYEPDIVDSSRIIISEYNPTPIRPVPQTPSTTSPSHAKTSKRPVTISGKTTTNPRTSLSSSSSSTQNPPRNFQRSNSVRHTINETSKKSVIPRRSGSVRKIESKDNSTKKNIERSTSKNSLVSSRSSLNSAASTNTVKRMPLKPSNNNSGNGTINKAASRMVNGIKPGSSGKQSSGSVTRPPKAQLSSFMKPTASSTTKSTNQSSKTPGRLFPRFKN